MKSLIAAAILPLCMAAMLVSCETIVPPADPAGNITENPITPRDTTRDPVTPPDTTVDPRTFWTTYSTGINRLPAGTISSMAAGSDRLWITVSETGSLYYFQNGQGKSVTLGNVYAPSEPWRVAVDSDNNVWNLEWKGNSKTVVARAGTEKIAFGDLGGLANTGLVDVMARGGSVWVSTEKGAARFEAGTWSKLSVTGWSAGTYLAAEQDGQLWGLSGDSLKKYDGARWRAVVAPSSRKGFTTALCDLNGHVWWACAGGPLYRYDGTRAHEVNLAGASARGIATTTEGVIWAATSSGAYRIEGDAVTRFSTQQGLPTNDLFSVVVDPQGNTWFGAKDKLIRYNGK